VAAGDIGPFFHNRLAADIGALWGYGLTGTGSATVEIARLPEAVIATAAGWAGFAPELAQLGWFWLWLTGASAACIVLARQLGAGSPAAAVLGVLAVVNPLFALNLPNVLVAAAVCSLALVAAALVRAGRGRGRLRYTLLATLPLSYLAVNPPTLFVVAAVVAAGTGAALAFLPRARGPLARHLGFAAPAALAANLWWIVPAWVLYLGGGGPRQAAVTDPQDWAWAHVNNSVANVATLTAHWTWGLGGLVPFSERLDQLPWSPLRWALPALALAACPLASSPALRRTALAALGVALGLIMIGKGLHPPAEWFNAWLYEHVPGMWLLREPVSKVGPVLLVCYLVGAAIAVDGAITRLRVARPRRAVLGSLGLATLVAGAVLFGHPVVTGGVAPTDRTPLPPARVAVPAGWGDLAAALNADPVAGKALVLPTQPFYQATTTWGFHGVATLPRDLLARPTLLALPGGYFSYPPVAGALVDVVSTTDDRAHLARALDALGVSHVIVRTDLADLQPVLPIAGPEPLLARLELSGLFDAPVDYGPATVLRRAPAHGGAQVFAGGARVLAAGPAGMARAVASLPPSAAAIGTGVGDAGEGVDITTSVFDTYEEGVEAVLRVPAPGRYTISAVPHRSLTAAVSPGGDGAVVDPGLEISLDGEVLGRSAAIRVPSPHPGTQVVAVSVDGTPTLLAEGPVGVEVVDGASLSALAPAGSPRPFTAWSEVMNCNPLDERDAGLGAAVQGGSVELWARRHAACVAAAAPVSGRALLSFEAQVAEGPAARACLWSPSAGRCVWERVITADTSAWVAIREVIDVPTDALLHLYADAPSGPARTRYRDLTAVALAEGPAVTARLDLAVGGVELAAGEHAVVLARRTPQQFGAGRVGEVSPVGNCHARTPGAVVSATFADDVVRLKADHDAACVSFPIEQLAPGVTYEVVLEYRTRTRPAGRWCLWLDGPDRCANKTVVLPHSPTWAVHRDRVTVPEGVSGARLYVYADADPGRPGALTINEYRRPTLRPERPVTVTVSGDADAAGTADPEPGAVLRSATAGPDRWQLTVVGAGRPFLVALPDAHDTGWALAGLPAGASAVPTTVDGYRQAWAVSGLTGEATLTAHYAPAAAAIAARWASLLAVGAVVLPWPWLLRSARRRTRTPLG
jgi:arabinofuranan 3-O-arabinosyltransferase